MARLSLFSQLFLISFSLAKRPTGAAARQRVPEREALPLHAGVANGIFARHDIAIELSFTENSTGSARAWPRDHRHRAFAAVDNAVAMVEVAKQDVIIVTGGDSGMNEFFVQPLRASFADLRGRSWS